MLRVLATAAVLAATGAAPASAAVTIGPARVVVEGDGARAVIQRRPFRISIEDGAGTPVLRQVPNPRSGPRLRLPEVDPEPAGADLLAEQAFYGPLTFEVGLDRALQQPGGLWGGTLLLGLRLGVVHFARDVIGARPEGDGVRLTLSTSDPGRRLSVRVAPDGRRAIRVRARPSDPRGVSAIGDSFASGGDEAFHGFGGRHNGLSQRGNAFYNWVEGQNVGAGPLQPVADLIPGGGGRRYMFPTGPAAAYYVQNQFVSSRPYGFYLDNPELSRWRMAADRPSAWQVSAAAASLDYTVAVGPPREAIETLTAITGRHRQPAEWALGPTLSRPVRVLSPEADTPQGYAAKVRDDIRRIEGEGLPVSSYTIEAWDFISRPDLRDLVRRLHARGIRVLLYIRSFASVDVASTERPNVFLEALRNGHFATTPGGAPFLFPSTFIAGVAGLLDFTNPATVRAWERRVREMLDLGADGFMQDFGEQVLVDMRFGNGETGATMHNRYPVVYHRVTREILDRYEAEHPGREIFFYTRAGFSGRPGAAAYESSNFPGDETTDWGVASGIASVIPDMLNRGVGGAVGFNTDIGGYADQHTGPVSKELFVRWSQLAALTPVFRVHNSGSTGAKMPWSFDRAALEAWREAAELHVRARPLLHALWAEAEASGQPIATPLWLAFPDDRAAAREDQQWMLGEDVLVAPVVEQGARARRVYFPEGCWRHGETGAEHHGPGHQVVPAPLDSLPYFLRCGTRPF